MNDTPTLNFIAWKPEYNCSVKIIDCQHKDTLMYLNSWYADIKLRKDKLKNPQKYLTSKLRYLNHFCSQHLSFEEDVLTILATSYGFNEKAFHDHIKVHRHFSESLLLGLTEQINQFIKSGSIYLLDDLIVESLKDIAKWWFHHISGHEKKEICNDNTYREFMKTLTKDAQLNLLNDIITKAELIA
jgi:hemerythrin